MFGLAPATVGEMLMPIVGAMRRELLSGGYIQADEAPVDVQSERTKGKNHQAYLWQYSRPGGRRTAWSAEGKS